MKQILLSNRFFKHLSDDTLEKIVIAGKTKRFAKNTMLFYEGDKGNFVYVLLEGAVKLFKMAKDGREIMIKLVKPGELFAEAILFGDSAYPVNALNVVPTNLMLLPKDQIYLLLESKEFRDTFLTSIMNRLRYLTGHIHYLTAYDVEERFFQFLRQRYGQKEYYEIDISKKEFASAIGTIPETLSRLLNRLAQRGIARWQESSIEILDTSVWDNIY